MTNFQPGEQAWIDRRGNLRDVVRQELITRQIAPFVRQEMTVLDVGCGQGTQALRLSSRGCQVTGVDPSSQLLDLCANAATEQGLDVDLLRGGVDDLGDVCGGKQFDLVCCHGVMMYLDDREPAVATLSDRLAVGGKMSVTFRNGHALAMRPGLRGNWTAALAAFRSTAYVNELGLPAEADRVHDIESALTSAGLRTLAWYGVRVFTDATSPEALPPPPESLGFLLDAEEQAGATEPYKWMASQLHFIAEQVS